MRLVFEVPGPVIITTTGKGMVSKGLFIICTSVCSEEGLAVAQEPLWTAGYDGPGVFINRRNQRL